MLPYIYLVGATVFSSVTAIIGGIYNRKNEGRKGGVATYNLILLSSVLLFWLVMFLTDLNVNAKVLPYSLIFGVAYVTCNIVLIQALKTGPVVLTSLILQLSIIGATIWGFFFWDNTEFTLLVGLGLVLVAITLTLCLYNGKKEGDNKITLKWVIYVFIAFVGNATCTISQKTMIMNCGDSSSNFMMLIAMAVGLIGSLVYFLVVQKSDAKVIVKQTGYMPVVSGLCNGGVNLFVILLATTTLSPSLIYPVISVGGLMITTLFSFFVFKERLRWWQWVGVAVGAVAVTILSI